MHPGSMLILILATIGQPPGGDGPATGPRTPVVKRWMEGVSPIDGKPIRFLGWLDATGKQRFDPLDYPQFVLTPVPATPPKDQPPARSATGDLPGSGQGQPTGVIFAKFPPVTAAHTWTGGNVGAVGQAEAKDHAASPDVYVTIIGPKRERDRVKAELARDPAFATLRKEMGSRLAVEAYDPKNPLVADVGLVAGGLPDVVVLDAGGKEIARFDRDPGPQPIADAVRKADPSYRPGGGKVSPSGGLGLGWIAMGLVALGAIVLGLRKGAAL